MTAPTLADVPKQTRPKMVMESFRLPPTVSEAFRKRCLELQENKSDVLRELVEEWLAGEN